MRFDIHAASLGELNGFKAEPGALSIKLSWNLPSDLSNYRATQIWVNKVNDRETATLLNTVSGNVFDFQVGDATTRYFWIRTIDQYNRVGPVFTGPASGKAGLVTSAQIPVFDLATTTILGKLSSGSITGLGALATLNTVDVSRVNNLGALATADRIYADEIGAGRLAAGVVYAGTINADQINAGTMTGQIIRSSAGSTRIAINENQSNAVRAYIGGRLVASFGGGDGGIIGSGQQSYTYGVIGDNVSGTGVAGSSGTGVGVFATSESGIALRVDGVYQQGTYSESDNKSTRTNNCIPVSSNTYNLGTFARTWMGITSQSAVVVTSDGRLKKDIEDSNLGLEFINKLRPVSYRMKEGRKEIEPNPTGVGPWPEGVEPEEPTIAVSVEGTRHHYGLIAQEVKQAMTDSGVDDAAFWALADPADPDSTQALRYEELISPMIKAIQEMSELVKSQGEEIALLKQQIGS